MISPYAYVGLKNVLVFGKMETSKSTKIAYITVHPKTGNLYFSIKSDDYIGLAIGDRVHFVVLGDSIYLCKSTELGTKVFKRGKCLSSQSKLIGNYFREKLGAFRKVRCMIKKRQSEFNGSPLFEVQLPYRYKRSFFINQNKTA
jgi:hypothetical protein